ncbi:glycosyltransferase [Hyphobacterium sp. CCMP332]|nr:glycosyltransferase [Hyphobacterium sp. CCMP332]
MSVSLIIAVYKRLDFLSLVFQSIDAQSFKNFEVIIAEDNNQAETKIFIEKAQKTHKFSIKHVFQEDLGFRKNKILNEAIRLSSAEKLVFIDGDCIIHKHFIKNYNSVIGEGIARAGRRIELSEKHTLSMLRKGELIGLDVLSLLMRNARYPEKALYLPNVKSLNSGFKHLLGCNWGIMKNDLMAINGFDEDYELSGVGEDSDVEWRLLKAGIKIESIIYSCLEYHLYHPVHYNQKILDENLKMLERKKNEGRAFCENGLIK